MYMKILHGKQGEVFNMKNKNEIPNVYASFLELVFLKNLEMSETVIC